MILQLLAEKFIKDAEILRRLKGMKSVGIINQMIANDKAIEIAKNLLRKGFSADVVSETTGVDEPTVLSLQAELNAA